MSLQVEENQGRAGTTSHWDSRDRSLDRNRMTQRLVEEIALLIEGNCSRLGIACRVRGAGHEGVLACSSIPGKLKACPRVLDLRFQHPGFNPGCTGINTPLHTSDCAERRMGMAVQAVWADAQLGRPGQCKRTLDHLSSNHLASCFTIRRIRIANEPLQVWICILRPQLPTEKDPQT